jgi:hypothetical protein
LTTSVCSGPDFTQSVRNGCRAVSLTNSCWLGFSSGAAPEWTLRGFFSSVAA